MAEDEKLKKMQSILKSNQKGSRYTPYQKLGFLSQIPKRNSLQTDC